ncbi:MAG TPA: glycosyltransferase [Acidimicrobiales bacterium]|nr:glycosyltransferase [Acidimicrobiales bacterium]
MTGALSLSAALARSTPLADLGWPRQPEHFRPIAVTEVELESGLQSIDPSRLPPVSMSVLTLVRLHTQPLGLVRLDLDGPDRMLSWTRAVRGAIGPALEAHARSDGQPIPSNHDLWAGWTNPSPRCLSERAAVLADAPPVTVVIATRERPDQLARCLASVLDVEYPNFDVLVVDNDPESDETARRVEAIGRRAPVRYLRERRRGLGASHNRALPEVTGDIVAFTDDDVVVDRHWLSELATPFVTRESVKGATGLILPAELETAAQFMLELHGRFAKGFNPTTFDLRGSQSTDRLFPFTAGRLGSGANMAFDAHYLRAIGGFDAALGTGSPARGGDDLAALFGLIADGHTLAYRPGAVIWHHHRRDLPAVRRQAWGYGIGQGAFLTSALLGQPRTALWLLPRLPAGIVRAWRGAPPPAPASAMAPSGPTGRDGVAGLPSKLSRLQQLGLLVGPFAYVASRYSGRRWNTGAPRVLSDSSRP